MAEFTGADEELSSLLGDIYVCTRAWSAWGYGTMTEEDFVPASWEPDIHADLIAWRDAAVAAERDRFRSAIQAERHARKETAGRYGLAHYTDALDWALSLMDAAAKEEP